MSGSKHANQTEMNSRENRRTNSLDRWRNYSRNASANWQEFSSFQQHIFRRNRPHDSMRHRAFQIRSTFACSPENFGQNFIFCTGCSGCFPFLICRCFLATVPWGILTSINALATDQPCRTRTDPLKSDDRVAHSKLSRLMDQSNTRR